MADNRKIKGALDRISNLPDVILQHILCFTPTKLAITTSLLSKRWRHVWCDIPSLSLSANSLTAASINETLTRYTAPKTNSFHLTITPIMENIPYIDRWINFAMSHNVENLSLHYSRYDYEYTLPGFLYKRSSFKPLNIYSDKIVPLECTVSWTSLHKLSLSCCRISDESMAKILSGCPTLEKLKLYECGELKVLDLSKSLRLKTLEVSGSVMVAGPTQIVAPQIHFLRLFNSQTSCTLVDVDSIIEAKLEICYDQTNPYFKLPGFLQVMVLEMLEKLQNAKKLTFGGNFIQIVSLAEILGVPFPLLKVKSLTLDTDICQYVIPGIERLLRNSPNLEMLIVRGRSCSTIPEEHLDQYLKLKSLNPDQCWRSKDGFSWNKSCWNLQPKQVASFVELVLTNTEKLLKMVILLDERYPKFNIKEVVSTLCPKSNVTIVFSTNKPMTSEDW